MSSCMEWEDECVNNDHFYLVLESFSLRFYVAFMLGSACWCSWGDEDSRSKVNKEKLVGARKNESHLVESKKTSGEHIKLNYEENFKVKFLMNFI